MSSLPRNRPEKFYDLVVQVAIIRPGPIVGKMMQPLHAASAETRGSDVSASLSGIDTQTDARSTTLSRAALAYGNGRCKLPPAPKRKSFVVPFDMRRSWERMKNLEGRLKAGMTANGLDTETQETIIQKLSSFALYGFPESHAASFALIAYASAYHLK